MKRDDRKLTAAVAMLNLRRARYAPINDTQASGRIETLRDIWRECMRLALRQGV